MPTGRMAKMEGGLTPPRKLCVDTTMAWQRIRIGGSTTTDLSGWISKTEAHREGLDTLRVVS